MGYNYGVHRPRNERIQTSDSFTIFSIAQNNAQDEKNDSPDTYNHIITENFRKATERIRDNGF